MIKLLNKLISESPTLYGFKEINEVADLISGTHHGIMLGGVLLFAGLVNKDGIKSIIITSTSDISKFIISIIYDNYSMIHNGANYESIEANINSFDSKNLREIKTILDSKFKEL